MNDVLTVYFTKTGNSRKIAEQISVKLNSDLDEINEKRALKGLTGLITGGFCSIFEKTAAITFKKEPDKYKVVIIVAPVWASRVPPAVRAYIYQNLDNVKNYGFIINNEGSDIKKAIKNFKKILPNSIAEYGTSNKHIDTESCQKCFEDFSDSVRRVLEEEKTNA